MGHPENGLICVAVGRPTVDQALAAVREVAGLADVVEIRLDSLDSPAVAPFMQSLTPPLLFTCRPSWEGGLFRGAEEERVELLVDASRLGAGFVDLELRAPAASFQQLKTALKTSPTRLIVSNHDFEMTPDVDTLHDILHQMADKGAEIGKIITTAHTHFDVLRVLQLQEEAARIGLPLIAFCMGRAGVISRLATLELGGFMSYCTVNEQEATAPGQIPVRRMRQLLGELFAKE